MLKRTNSVIYYTIYKHFKMKVIYNVLNQNKTKAKFLYFFGDKVVADIEMYRNPRMKIDQ